MSKTRTEIRDGIAVVGWTTDRLMGDPDGTELRDEVGRVIDDGISRIAVDISTVRYSNSSGLGILISAWVMARERGAELVVVIGSDRIKNLFGVTNLDAIMKTYRSLDDAVAGLGA